MGKMTDLVLKDLFLTVAAAMFEDSGEYDLGVEVSFCLRVGYVSLYCQLLEKQHLHAPPRMPLLCMWKQALCVGDMELVRALRHQLIDGLSKLQATHALAPTTST
eukprot:1443269-Amphidinium_carterae.1